MLSLWESLSPEESPLIMEHAFIYLFIIVLNQKIIMQGTSISSLSHLFPISSLSHLPEHMKALLSFFTLRYVSLSGQWVLRSVVCHFQDKTIKSRLNSSFFLLPFLFQCPGSHMSGWRYLKMLKYSTASVTKR